MIIVYPMLVSRAVSENSIPGIAKTLENFIIVHYQDKIISNAGMKRFGKLSMKGGNLFLKEGEDLSEAGIPGDASPGNKKDKTSGGSKKTKDADFEDFNLPREETSDDVKKRREQKKEEQEEDARKARKASAKVVVSDTKSISLEPTYITIEKSDEHGNKSNAFIGIKVIPIRVKSDVKLSHLLLYDSKLGAIKGAFVAFGRFVTRGAYRFFDKWTRYFRIGGVTPSGDPRRDIIMGRTGMGKDSESFIVLSKQEDIDETFLDNIQKLNRLFKMGWGNFVIADDIGRNAYFCMSKFKGMCNVIPYAMMYQYLGQSKAYESMEDAKKQNSSIFKVSQRFSRVIGEWRVANKLYKYSQLNEGDHNE